MSASAYAPSNAFLLALANANQDTADEALSSGAGEIDEAFASGGYATPIDLSALDAGDAKTRLSGRLADANRAIAAWILSSPATATGKKGSSDKVEKDYKRIRAWLDRVRDRLVTVPPLVPAVSGIDAGGLATGVQVVGDSEWPDTDSLYQLAQRLVLR